MTRWSERGGGDAGAHHGEGGRDFEEDAVDEGAWDGFGSEGRGQCGEGDVDGGDTAEGRGAVETEARADDRDDLFANLK